VVYSCSAARNLTATIENNRLLRRSIHGDAPGVHLECNRIALADGESGGASLVRIPSFRPLRGEFPRSEGIEANAVRVHRAEHCIFARHVRSVKIHAIGFCAVVDLNAAVATESNGDLVAVAFEAFDLPLVRCIQGTRLR
jgi:hypothetical protein